jgi:hypothetical protein
MAPALSWPSIRSWCSLCAGSGATPLCRPSDALLELLHDAEEGFLGFDCISSEGRAGPFLPCCFVSPDGCGFGTVRAARLVAGSARRPQAGRLGGGRFRRPCIALAGQLMKSVMSWASCIRCLMSIRWLKSTVVGRGSRGRLTLRPSGSWMRWSRCAAVHGQIEAQA